MPHPMDTPPPVGTSAGCTPGVDLAAIPEGITEWDMATFEALIATDLTPEEAERVATPPRTYPQQSRVLAVHWHPEQVPLELIRQRLATLYPQREAELIIPTQHNEILTYDGYAGVEIDCYARGFNRKVQLLLHFREANLTRADTLRAMCAHTRKYRSSQLFDFMRAVVDPDKDHLAQAAARETNTEADVVALVRRCTAKLHHLLQDHWERVPVDAVKNKLLRNYFDALRQVVDDRVIDKAQVFLKAVKERVKGQFPLTYFYRASEVIEEARALGAGIVIPHPEQFWPILLADYDVDGIEVWNPQSSQYTEFLIHAVNRQNTSWRKDHPLLIFMGDDCHMSEKLKPPAQQDPDKAGREIGLQPAWDDLAVRKSLVLTGVDRGRVIAAYKALLG